MSLCLSKKKQTHNFWGECLLHLLYLQDFLVSATITEIAVYYSGVRKYQLYSCTLNVNYIPWCNALLCRL